MNHSKKSIQYADERVGDIVSALKKRDARIQALEEENAELRESIDEYIEMIGEYQDMVKDLNGAIESYLSPDDDDKPSDGFYSDDDCEPGTIKMQYRRSTGEVELLTPKKKKRFEGIKMHITPGQGFGIGIVTRDVPR